MEEKETKVYSVTEITYHIRRLVQGDPVLAELLIRGEVSRFSASGAGHLYFTLKDENCELPCVMFRAEAESVEAKLEDGQRVIVAGRIDVYANKGRYQLIASEIKPEGLGDLYVAFEKLKKKLEEEGLFKEEFKKPLPAFPKRIGVVTSTTGAAVRDILKILGRRYPIADVVLAPATVQGDQAPPTIIEGIQGLNALGNVDVMIVGRGGGSFEDLWCFNDELLARAVFASEVPIVSAVGHETDFSICDFVADKRAATPSAAAELVVPDMMEIMNQIYSMRGLFEDEMTEFISRYRDSTVTLRSQLRPGILLDLVNMNRQRLDEVHMNLTTSQKHLLEMTRQGMEKLGSMLDAVNPLATLDRGYSVALKLPQKSIVDGIAAVEVGNDIRLMVKDGDIECEVKGKKEVDRWQKS
ncbi:MAG: exodeoxyribonuclease VII large subunit [Methanobacteriota archaeon]|nr:MAG: exodeoxyribonuclease VII large subunit [Euryarchaeota archaeon]